MPFALATSRWLHRTCTCLVAVVSISLLAVAIWVPAARAEPATFAGASADGEIVFFTTAEKLVPGDTDNKRDVYERFYDSEAGIESYVTREVSTGPTGGNDPHDVSYDGVSESGTRVFFSTAESLVAEDSDLSVDVYMRDLSNGSTTLVSKPSSTCLAVNCGNAALPADFDAVSESGTRVVFSSDESLSAEDGDAVGDVYIRNLQTGTTTLVSKANPSCLAANCGDGPALAFFDAASTDALEVAFSSGEALSGEDDDAGEDIYLRDVGAGLTSLVSQKGTCPPLVPAAACTPIFGGLSGDGSHVFYESRERLAGDSDELQDVYGWSGAAPTLVSTGPGDSGSANAIYRGSTADGSGAFFETGESLSSEDEDATADVYERSGSVTTLVSTGPTAGVTGSPASFAQTTPDGSTVFFSTAEKLTAEDTDTARDVYSRDIGAKTTALVSRPGVGCTGTCGNGAVDANFAGASSDGSAAFFETAEPLLPADSDSSLDIYERSGATTTLVSTGQLAKNLASNPHLSYVSEDGAHAVFITEERLTVDDLDTEPDVYDRTATGTLLVSTRNPDELVLGPATPALTGVTPVSPNPSTEPRIHGHADFETLIKVYASVDCSGVPAATGTAAELEGSGIKVSVAPGSTTTFHATATLLNDTSACSSDSVNYQQAAETGGGGGGGGGGSGDPGTGAGSGSTPPGSHGGPVVGVGQHVAPQTRITFAPGAKTRLRRPTFQFVDSTGQAETSFLCRVDRGRWAACESPQRLKRLSPGRHIFAVKGINSGLSEQLPVSRRFKVVPR
jgi:hypothetical protein